MREEESELGLSGQGEGRERDCLNREEKEGAGENRGEE